MVFGMTSVVIKDLLSGYTVKLLRLDTKRCWRNILYLNFRTAINQPAVFMQDSAPCHTVKSLKTFLFEEDVTIMKWPTQTKNLNPIENIWKLLSERAKEKNPRNIEELRTNLKREWEKISVDECKTLINSCSKRYQVVIESKGLYIKY